MLAVRAAATIAIVGEYAEQSGTPAEVVVVPRRMSFASPGMPSVDG